MKKIKKYQNLEKNRTKIFKMEKTVSIRENNYGMSTVYM